MNYLEIGYWSVIFTIAYVNRYSLLTWGNYNYRNLKEYIQELRKNKNVSNIKPININNKVFYEYTFFGKTFIGFNENFSNIDIEKYKKFIRSNNTNTQPEHIISSEASIIDDIGHKKDIDILESIQQLCGPFLDQINDSHKEDIKSYIVENYTNIAEIEKIELMLMDGDEISLKY